MISRLYHPRLLYDDFNIRLPSSEWSSSEVKINIQTWHLVPSSPRPLIPLVPSSSRSGCEDIFINKQLTGHSHAFAASLPLGGVEWTWTGKWGTGQREATGEQGSERRRRAQCENCCMKSKVSSRQMHFLFCSYRAACPEISDGFYASLLSDVNIWQTSQRAEIQPVHLRVRNKYLTQRAAGFTLTISLFNSA